MRFVYVAQCLATCAVALPQQAGTGQGLAAEQLKRAPEKYWIEGIEHNGISAFIPDGHNWTVFRNVKDFGAKGDGVHDDSPAIQAAINYANGKVIRGNTTFSQYGTLGGPALVYIPSGTYLLRSEIYGAVDTMVMGDPISRPVLKAASSFSSPFVWKGNQGDLNSVINFYLGIKNVIFDTTAVDGKQNITMLDWSVAQACQLANNEFNMAPGATGHGAIMMPEGGSPLEINDCAFSGGAFGIAINAQQYQLKSLTFKNVGIGLRLDKLFEGTCVNCQFEGCKVGVDTSNGNVGFFALVDSAATNTEIMVNASVLHQNLGSLVLENVQVDNSVGSTVRVANKEVLRGSVDDGRAWIMGNAYHAGPEKSATRMDLGRMFDVQRSPALLDGFGKYPAIPPPTYQDYGVSNVLNAKSVRSYPVSGDGKTDDTTNLQQVINLAARSNKILFLPQGDYIVTDTIVLPPGSRVFGEVWSSISAKGDKFKDAHRPIPMIQVGYEGQYGVAQMSDVVFSVAEKVPGCILVQFNMAGFQAGDVGMWNSHVRIGGGPGTTLHNNCENPATCKAARLGIHISKSSSVYIDNSWTWSADHTLDVEDLVQNPDTAGGIFVEAVKGTWLFGIGSEHHDLYQMNMYRASNVLLGFQQSETPYWQGNASTIMPPQAWEAELWPGEPKFDWCATDDIHCRKALYQYISESSNIYAYGGGFWTYFDGRVGCSAPCQTNAVYYEENGENFYVFGVNTHMSSNLILETQGQGPHAPNHAQIAPQSQNKGGWNPYGGIVAAYLPQIAWY